MDLAPKRLLNHLLPVNLDNEILEIYISNNKIDTSMEKL